MIKALIDNVATKLVTLNPWLSEIRTLGYLRRQSLAFERDKFIVYGKDGIGLTDQRGNSGYIRFRTEQNYTVSELPARYSSCQVIGQRITIALRLVLLFDSDLPKEDIPFYLTIQMNSLTFEGEDMSNRNVRVRVQSAGSNTLANVLTETGSETTNTASEVIYIDFNISFDWNQSCDQINIPIDMSCNECEDPLDFGCIQSCEHLELYQNADSTGTWTMKTVFNGISITQSFDVVNGEPVAIPMENLTPDYLYTIRVYNSDNELVEILDESPTPVEHECLQIKIIP